MNMNTQIYSLVYSLYTGDRSLNYENKHSCIFNNNNMRSAFSQRLMYDYIF